MAIDTTEKRDDEIMSKTLEALTALVNLATTKVNIEAMAKAAEGDETELTKILQNSGQEGRDVIQLMKDALAEAEGGASVKSGQGYDQAVKDVMSEAKAVGVVVEKVALPEPEPIKVKIVGEDREAIKKGFSDRRAGAIADLTRAETESATRAVYGVTNPNEWDSVLGLLSKEGAMDSRLDAQGGGGTGRRWVDVNKYLQIRAREIGKKNVEQLSNEEYKDIVGDRVSFSEWAAKQWVDEYMKKRKKEIGEVAKEIAGFVDVSGEQRFAERLLESVPQLGEEFEKKRGERDEASMARRRLYDVIQKNETATRKKLQQELDNFDVMAKNQEEQMTTLHMPEVVVVETRKNLQTTRSTLVRSHEQTLVDEKKVADVLMDKAKEELERRKTEIESLADQARFQTKVGVKRELSLSAGRWGATLSKLVEKNPWMIKKDEMTGEVTLNVDYGSKAPEILYSRIDKELDLILKQDKTGRDAALRIKNLEAIIRTPAEVQLAREYLYGKLVELPNREDRGAKVDKATEEKINILQSYLLDNKLEGRDVSLVFERTALEYKITLKKSAVEAVINEEGSRMHDTEQKETPIEHYTNKEMLAFFEKKLEDFVNNKNDGAFGKKLDSFLDIALNRGKDQHFFGAIKTKLFNIYTQLNSIKEKRKKQNLSGYGIVNGEEIIAKIYRLNTRSESKTSVSSLSRYSLPDTLKNNLLYGSYSFYEGNITSAAFEQVRLHYLRWSEESSKGQEMALKYIEDDINEIYSNIKSEMPYSIKDPTSAIEEIEESFKKANDILVKRKKLLEKLGELYKEVKNS